MAPTGVKLNLGCGPVQPAGWTNVDGSNRAWFASKWNGLDRLLVKMGAIPPTEFGPQIKVWNLAKRFPCADGSISAIYAGEILEHFEYQAAEAFARECFRVLAPGGVLRVCVPDGPQYWQAYLDMFSKTMSEPRAARKAEPLRQYVKLFFNDICTRRAWLRSLGHYHKWQFDEVQLIDVFERAGFAQVERQKFRDSRIPDIGALERSDFLIVEGVKP